MSVRTVATTVALALCIAGCASGPSKPPSPGDPRILACSDQECHVKIAVTNCTVTVTPEFIEITKKNVNIHWDIESGDYTFPERGGIVIKDYDPEREFTDPSRPTPKKWILKDKNTFAKYFPYGVQVVDRNGAACPLHDPGVINHG